jgi:hypothetical protein
MAEAQVRRTSGAWWTTPAGSSAKDAGNVVAASFENSPRGSRALPRGSALRRLVIRRRRERGPCYCSKFHGGAGSKRTVGQRAQPQRASDGVVLLCISAQT